MIPFRAGVLPAFFMPENQSPVLYPPVARGFTTFAKPVVKQLKHRKYE